MDFINDFSDSRNKAWCIHCGTTLQSTKSNKDHVPSKSLLRTPPPPMLPTVRICQTCNESFSFDERYVATFIACVIVGSTEPGSHADKRTRERLEKHPNLRALIERSRVPYRTIGGDHRVVWRPDFNRINNVVLKNARGHAFYEFGEPMLAEPSSIATTPFDAMAPDERRDFESCEAGSLDVWPEVGSRAMQRLLTGQDMEGPWVIVQDDVYRYSVSQHGSGLRVRTVISEYLATEVTWKS